MMTQHLFSLLPLQGKQLLDNIHAVTDAEEALSGAELVVHAVPVQFSLDYLKKIKYVPFLPFLARR